MTFRDPAMLAGLLLLPLAALAYFSFQRRRRAEAATFANPALMPNLVTGRPGWRRHLPPLLILLALGALVVALARPQLLGGQLVRGLLDEPLVVLEAERDHCRLRR